jgi:hypothetical protein
MDGVAVAAIGVKVVRDSVGVAVFVFAAVENIAACFVNCAMAVTTASVRTRFRSGVGRVTCGAAQLVMSSAVMAMNNPILPKFFLYIFPPIVSVARELAREVGGIVN